MLAGCAIDAGRRADRAARGAGRLQGTRRPLGRTAAGRGAAARRVVEGLRRPAARRPGRARRPQQHQHPARRRAAGAGPRAGARRPTPTACRRSALGAGVRQTAARRPGASARPAPATDGQRRRQRRRTSPTCSAASPRRATPPRSTRSRARRWCRARGCWCSPTWRRPTSALRALDAERALVRETVAAYRDTLRLTERRYQAGDVAELDLARVQHRGRVDRIAGARARPPPRRARARARRADRRAAERASALGRSRLDRRAAAGAARRAEHACSRAGPTWPRRSARCRRRRPASASRSTAWFPDVSLTASGGFASTDLGDLFKWSARAWGVGALLSLPIFDGGRREAGVQNANAAVGRRRGELPRAGAGRVPRRRGPALGAAPAGRPGRARRPRPSTSASRATVLSTSRYRNGYVSQLELLDARRSELANRRAGAAGARGAVPGDGRPDPRARRRLGGGGRAGERAERHWRHDRRTVVLRNPLRPRGRADVGPGVRRPAAAARVPGHAAIVRPLPRVRADRAAARLVRSARG